MTQFKYKTQEEEDEFISKQHGGITAWFYRSRLFV